MYILGIDTSAVSASAAVLKDGKLISECYVNSGLTHSQTLMTLVDSALSQVGITVRDIDIYAVAHGPGSFTGIRIGVSAVKGMSFFENKPCYGVSTLEALALCAGSEGRIICPVMDARCNQVYTALFRVENGEAVRLSEDEPMSLETLAERLKGSDEKTVLIGDGADIAYDYLRKKVENTVKFSEIFKYQHASGVAFAAYRMYNKGISPCSGGELQPVYLRLSQAERELNKKNRSEEK